MFSRAFKASSVASKLQERLSISLLARPRTYFHTSASSNNNDKSNDKSYSRRSRTATPSFMPLINISQNEFAHDAFFALHGPLGLISNDKEVYDDTIGAKWNGKGREAEDETEELAWYFPNFRSINPGLNANVPFEPIIQFARFYSHDPDAQIAKFLNTIESDLQQQILDEAEPSNSMWATSTLRKRRLKMNKHKHKKHLKATRALRKRLGK